MHGISTVCRGKLLAGGEAPRAWGRVEGKSGTAAISGGLDDGPGPADGSIQIPIDSGFPLMVGPDVSFGANALPDLLIGGASSGESDGVGEIGCGFIASKVVAPGKKGLTTHKPPWVGMGNCWRYGRLGSEGWDVGLGDPVDPDELCERVSAIGRAVLLLGVSKARGAPPSVLGVGCGVAVHFLEPELFFMGCQGPFGVNPDLEVSR